MIKQSIKLASLAILAALMATTVAAEEIQAEYKHPGFEATRNVAPVYPQRALDRKITGYTLVEYKINDKGRTENVKIVDAEPSSIFDKASKRAVLRTVYDKADAAKAEGSTFYQLYVFELDATNANTLASNR